MTQMTSIPESLEKLAFQILVSKYQADPSWFDRHLPEVGEIVRQAASQSRRSRSPFGLTDREKDHHIEALLSVESAGKLGSLDAIRALEHCAYLIRDNSLPDCMDYGSLVPLFKAAFGKSPGSFRKNTTIPIEGIRDVEPVHRVSLVRGVTLNLNLEMRLVSVAVTPRKIRERKKLMSVVGIGHDPVSDVSRRHDEYLAEQSPHASS